MKYIVKHKQVFYKGYDSITLNQILNSVNLIKEKFPKAKDKDIYIENEYSEDDFECMGEATWSVSYKLLK